MTRCPQRANYNGDQQRQGQTCAGARPRYSLCHGVVISMAMCITSTGSRHRSCARYQGVTTLRVGAAAVKLSAVHRTVKRIESFQSDSAAVHLALEREVELYIRRVTQHFAHLQTGAVQSHFNVSNCLSDREVIAAVKHIGHVDPAGCRTPQEARA
jgi:hypothetical protein